MNASARVRRYRLTHITDWLEQLDGAICNTAEDEVLELESGTWLSELYLTGWEITSAHQRRLATPAQVEEDTEAQGDSKWMPSTTCSPTC